MTSMSPLLINSSKVTLGCMMVRNFVIHQLHIGLHSNLQYHYRLMQVVRYPFKLVSLFMEPGEASFNSSGGIVIGAVVDDLGLIHIIATFAATGDREIIPLLGAQDGAVETLDEVMQTSYTNSEGENRELLLFWSRPALSEHVLGLHSTFLYDVSLKHNMGSTVHSL